MKASWKWRVNDTEKVGHLFISMDFIKFVDQDKQFFEADDISNVHWNGHFFIHRWPWFEDANKCISYPPLHLDAVDITIMLVYSIFIFHRIDEEYWRSRLAMVGCYLNRETTIFQKMRVSGAMPISPEREIIFCVVVTIWITEHLQSTPNPKMFWVRWFLKIHIYCKIIRAISVCGAILIRAQIIEKLMQFD